MQPAGPHRRLNPLTGESVLVSAHRTKRPWQGHEESPNPPPAADYDPDCYLCPGNERAGGAVNPDYESSFVFTNDFPALLPDNPDADWTGPGFFRAQTISGTSRVVCFTPRHDLTLAQMSTPGLRTVVDVLADQVQELGDQFAYVQPFENRGAAMGASNPHPHGQIWAESVVPGLPSLERESQREYAATNGGSMLPAYAAAELDAEERVIAANERWMSVVPYWAVWPFETLIIPTDQVSHLPNLDEENRNDLADVLRQTLVRYDNLFRHPFPYSMGWHGRPFDEPDDGTFTLHAHLYPPLLRSATVRKFMVGYEMLAEPQRDITAEQAAARLRELSERHYLHAVG